MKASNRWMKTAITAVAAMGMVIPMAACGSDTAGGSASTSSDGPVTIEWWGATQGLQEQADAFNKSQNKIKVEFKKQASKAKTEEGVVNAVKAGNAPDLFESDMDSSLSLLVDGTIQDIAQYNPDLSKLNQNVVDSFKIGDQLAVIPTQSSPQFIIANQKTFDDNGVKVPTTWDELIQAGKDLKAKNPDIKIMNFPGEDPSTLVLLAQQFGAQWYSVDGDTWVVDINGPETKKAVNYLQQIVDNDMFSQKTYIEWDALMQFFQSGDLALIGTSTWQLSAYQSNFQKSLGDWKAYAWPKESASSDVVSPLNASGNAIPTGAKHPKEAAELATWLATNDEALKIAANAQTGSGAFPALKDVGDYPTASLPDKLLADNTEAAKVVQQAADTVAPYKTGANWSQMFKQLQDQWAKFLNKQVTGEQMLDTVQQWTVNDLTQKGINVKSAN
ncbi:ABC transporter substrate-binding protein [Bifidobacterium avesanii]|uniref:Extracellular solute-binding protein n=1 Tax=Bifidobacterium avesanii TaxID=1798157 RepID=A0A7K3TI78_9BIFI|nr:extracellular solute-binding protein [Bifidobacterium avesanii]KAB8291041.1 ABC transporter substrate-binding protein [Bifidobacterium avesanii]NEG78807.1 extracellular solute-binding protein [Bifidobacterium avesanii]